MAKFNREEFTHEIQLNLKKFNRDELTRFTLTCALGALPFLAEYTPPFGYWGLNKKQHLLSVFRSINAAVAALATPELYSTDFAEAAYMAAPSAFAYSSPSALDAFSAAMAARVTARAAYSAAAASAAEAFAAFSAVFATSAPTAAAASAARCAGSAAAAYYYFIRNHTREENDRRFANLLNAIRQESLKTKISGWEKLEPFDVGLTNKFIADLRKIDFNFWADQYEAWIKGKFDTDKIKRALFLDNKILKQDPENILVYLESKST